MYVKLKPELGVDYHPGQVFFTTKPGSFLSGGIKLFTDAEDIGHSLFIASHCGLVVEGGKCIEAIESGVELTSLENYLDDPDVYICFATPVGQTQEAINISLKMAHELVARQVKYDYFALGGFVLYPKHVQDRPAENPLQNDDRWFCSEMIAYILQQTAYLRWANRPDLTQIIKSQHPSWWSPEALREAKIWGK